VDSTEREQLAKRRLAEAVVDKTWRVPAYEGAGPVVMTLRLPEVTITDSEGRFIVISPRQSELVSTRMSNISDWLCYGDEAWASDDADDQ